MPWTVTVMSTVPALCPGLTAVICVSEPTWKLNAGVAPNSTSIARENLARGSNSSVLVRRLATAKTYRRLDTQIAKAVGTLEAIASEDLVYNDEIDELRFQRRKEALEERRRGAATVVGLGDADCDAGARFGTRQPLGDVIAVASKSRRNLRLPDRIEVVDHPVQPSECRLGGGQGGSRR